MENANKKGFNLSIFALLSLLAFSAGGCAVGTTRATINHAPLEKITNKRHGNILVKQFIDERNEKDKPYIGNKRNGFGMVLGHIGAPADVKIENLLTEFFVEALREAGYNAVIETSKSDTTSTSRNYNAILEGRIRTFWLDLYMAVWHKVEVNIRLLDYDTKKPLWEKDIEGSKTNALWLGITSEFEKVISQALTIALNQAAQEFATDEFYRAITRKRL